jgi:hypothetical protein
MSCQRQVMSHDDIVRDCRVDGIFLVEPSDSRFSLRVVVTMREVKQTKKKNADGDDCENDDGDGNDNNDDDDEAEEELDEDDEEKNAKKRKRPARVPKARGVINIRNRIPLVHSGADMRLVLRPRKNSDGTRPDMQMAYDIVDCLRYKPLQKLKYAAIRAAVTEASSMVEKRLKRIEQHRSLASVNLVHFDEQSGIQDAGDTTIPKHVRQRLLQLGFQFDYPAQLAILQRPFENGSEVLRQRQLETALRGYYCMQASLLTNMGDAGSMGIGTRRGILHPWTVTHAINVLSQPPYLTPASLVEQLSVAQLLDCAATRDYIDAMFCYPKRCDIDVNALARRSCRDDVVARQWRLAAPDQPEMQGAKTMTKAFARMPQSAGPDFLWETARWFQSLPVGFGATLFECGETRETIDKAELEWRTSFKKTVKRNKRKAAAPAEIDDKADAMHEDDAEESDDLIAPGAAAREAGARDAEDETPLEETTNHNRHSRTHWLYAQLKVIEAAPSHCCLYKATTPLYMTTRAASAGYAIVKGTVALGKRLVLIAVRGSGYGVAGLAESVFMQQVVFTRDVREARVANNGQLPMVLMLYTSHARKQRFNNWRRAQKAAKLLFTITSMTLDDVIGDTNLHWNVRYRITQAARIIVVDAHRVCEHDMANVLASLVAHNKHAEVALVGEIDTQVPEPHRESGAPFIDMWHSNAFRVFDLDGGDGVIGACNSREEKGIDLLYSISTRQKYAARLCAPDKVATRARELADLVLGQNYSLHFVGYGRRAFEAGLRQVAEFLKAHLCKKDMKTQMGDLYERAVEIQSTLAAWSKASWLSSRIILTSMPYVKFRNVIVRYTTAFVADREALRIEPLARHKQLRGVAPRHTSLSLDTLNLYLMLDTTARELTGVNHVNCCGTDNPNLLSVARHRHELRAASVMMATDAARCVDECNAKVCLVLRQTITGNSFAEQLDSEQLFVGPLHCIDNVRLLMIRATSEQIDVTRELMVRPLGFYHRPPPTALRGMLEVAHGCELVGQASDGSNALVAAEDVCYDEYDLA